MPLRPTCVKCHKELICVKNEVMLVHFTNNDKEQGIDVCCEGDLWGCETCNFNIVIGLGTPILGIDIANPEEWFKHYYWIEVKYGRKK